MYECSCCIHGNFAFSLTHLGCCRFAHWMALHVLILQSIKTNQIKLYCTDVTASALRPLNCWRKNLKIKNNNPEQGKKETSENQSGGILFLGKDRRAIDVTCTQHNNSLPRIYKTSVSPRVWIL